MIGIPHHRIPFFGKDERGATIVEFAVVAPALMLLLIGGMELGHIGYVKGITRSALQAAARDSGLETGINSKATIDNRVRQRIHAVVPTATVNVLRTSYETFSNVAVAEDFTDANTNNRYDPGECFTDMNNNSRWDSDRGRVNDQGGADDVVLYTVDVRYQKIFPLWVMLGQSQLAVVQATTTLRNQPYGTQAARTGVQICP